MTNNNKIWLISIVSLLVFSLVLTVSYSFFTVSSIVGNNITVSLPNSSGISLVFSSEEVPLEYYWLSEELIGATGSVESYSVSSTVTLTTASGSSRVNCSYDLYYEPNDIFAYSINNTSHQKEFDLAVSYNNVSSTFNLTNVKRRAKIGSYTINNTSSNPKTDTFDFSIVHYILPTVDQSDHYGQEYSGTLVFEAGGCTL